MYLSDVYTVSGTRQIAGISIPVGRDSKGLPIGIQMIGDCYQEKKLPAHTHMNRQEVMHGRSWHTAEKGADNHGKNSMKTVIDRSPCRTLGH